jgi:hypothetical protein
MPRERWFYAKDNRRQGPFPRQQLVEALLGQPDPRNSLVWRHGLPAWTPAGEVPEIDRHLAPFVKARTPTPAPAAPEPVAAERGDGMGFGRAGDARGYAGIERDRAASASKTPYMVGAAVIVVALLGAWLFWPRSSPPPPPSGSSTSTTKDPGTSTSSTESPEPSTAPSEPGTVTTNARPTTSATKGGGQTPVADQEAELPSSELKKLRGVGSWAGDKLTITLYNGSTWRVTEIAVRTSRLTGDQFVDADKPAAFLPIGANVEAPVANLLNRVAPGRRRPSVNPDDTVKFEADVGAQPEAYRWRIEGAKGYPPRAGS